MRAALLPTTGDPFVVGYWLRNYATWRDEVDELVVLVNPAPSGDALAYVRREVEAAGGRLIHVDLALGHGGAIKRLLDETKADTVVLCEEDAFVRIEGAVDDAFYRIERGDVDVIGSPRGEEHGRRDFGPFNPADPAEIANNLWPAMLFARMADLRHTTQQFGDRKWFIGDEVEGLGPLTPGHCVIVNLGLDHIHLDTYAGTTFELRARGLSVELVHHARLYDLEASRHGLVFNEPWFHITGSTQLPFVLAPKPEILPDWGEGGGQWVRRLAWWERMVEYVEDAPGRDYYLQRFAHFEEEAGIDEDALAAWSLLYDQYVTWDESRVAVAA